MMIIYLPMAIWDTDLGTLVEKEMCIIRQTGRGG